jgi:hypothetical protein
VTTLRTSPSVSREATWTRSKRTRPQSLTTASNTSPTPFLTCKSRPRPPPLSPPRLPSTPPTEAPLPLLENWQRKSDARSCNDCLLPGHIAADCTTARGRPPPYESSSSGLPQRTKLFFRSMTLALQCVPDTGRTAWNSAGTTRMFCPS